MFLWHAAGELEDDDDEQEEEEDEDEVGIDDDEEEEEEEDKVGIDDEEEEEEEDGFFLAFVRRCTRHSCLSLPSCCPIVPRPVFLPFSPSSHKSM